MAVDERSGADEVGIGALFEVPPVTQARTSAGACIAFLSGVAALLAAPFSLMSGFALLLGGTACVAAVAGLSSTRRSLMAGSALAPTGLLFGLVALGLLGPRYAGVNTAIGDALAPTLTHLLHLLNGRLGLP